MRTTKDGLKTLNLKRNMDQHLGIFSPRKLLVCYANLLDSEALELHIPNSKGSVVGAGCWNGYYQIQRIFCFRNETTIAYNIYHRLTMDQAHSFFFFHIFIGI